MKGQDLRVIFGTGVDGEDLKTSSHQEAICFLRKWPIKKKYCALQRLLSTILLFLQHTSLNLYGFWSKKMGVISDLKAEGIDENWDLIKCVI